MKKYLTYALQSSGVRQTIITLAGSTVAAGIAAIAIILFSRSLGPSLFGEFSVGISIITILSMFNNGGLNTALLKLIGAATTNAHKNTIFSVALRLRLLFSVLIAVVYLALTPLLIQWFKLSHPEIVMLSLVLGYSTSYYEHLMVVMYTTHKFTQAAYLNIIQSLVKLVGSLFLLITHSQDLTAAYIVYSAAPYFSLPLAGFFLPKWVRITIKETSRRVTNQVLQVTKHAALATISTGIIDSISVLFVQGYLSSFETGLLGGTQRIALLFTLLAASLGDVLFARVAKYKRAQDLQSYMKKAVLLSAGSLASFLVVVPFSRFLLITTIGPQYAPGLPILNILLAGVFFQLATVPFLALFYTFDSDWYFSSTGLAQLLITIIGNMIFIPMYGLWGAALVRLVIRVLLGVFTAAMATKLYYQKIAALKKII